MLRALIVLLVIVVALVRGGSLRNVAALPLKWLPLAVLSFVLQLLIFTPFRSAPLVSSVTPVLYGLSMGLLVVWVAGNWRIPGMALMALGLLMNTVAIAANGGYMPVVPEYAASLGWLGGYASDTFVNNNSVAKSEGVYLWILTDILPVPRGVPFATILSIGDVVLTLGVCLLCYQTIRRTPQPEQSESLQVSA